MTDRIFSTNKEFSVDSGRFGDFTVDTYGDQVVTFEIDGSDWASFSITMDEFQAMFDWAKAQGIVK